MGHGKSMRATVKSVELTILRGGLRGECILASNITIRPPDDRIEFHHLPMDGFSDALARLMAECLERNVGLVVMVDEVDTVWDAHEWQSMRKSDRYRIKQSRKMGADLIWTAQFVDQVEKSIRNITEEVELVKAFPNPTISRREAGKRPWFIRGQRFRPGAVRELVGEQDKDKRLGSSIYRYRREHEAWYDTDELVMPVDTEALCGRHAKEEKESRCPRCNPPAAPVSGLAALAVVARDDRPEDHQLVV